jgi:hypothetical protein
VPTACAGRARANAMQCCPIPTAERFLPFLSFPFLFFSFARHLIFQHHPPLQTTLAMAEDGKPTVAFLGPASSYTHQVGYGSMFYVLWISCSSFVPGSAISGFVCVPRRGHWNFHHSLCFPVCFSAGISPLLYVGFCFLLANSWFSCSWTHV